MAYKVKKGDTVSQIAKDAGVRVQDIIAANPNLENVNKIKIGQSLKIPKPRTGKNIGSQGPFGRTSQTEMSMMRGDGKQYTTGVRAKMKAGAETTPTPKKARATVDEKSGRSALLAKAKTKKLQKEGKLPVSGVAKKRAEAAKEKARQKKNRERLAALRKKAASKNGTKMATPKPKPKKKPSRRQGRKK